MERRKFICNVSALSALLMPGGSLFFDAGSAEVVTFGLAADPHADLVPDHMARLEAFMSDVGEQDPELIIQLGDFCFPKQENRSFLKTWNQFRGPKYHVLGNHDMDISSKEVIMEFLEMPSRYYSFDQSGIHFVILDANMIHTTDGEWLHYDTANFYIDSNMRTFIDPQQLEWFEGDLADVSTPIVVFSHQSLSSPCWGVKNRLAVQKIMEAKNADSSKGKIIACFNGHDHIDYHRNINGIHYVEINSMAYQWIGEKYSNMTRYSADLYETYPSLDKCAPYVDSLYTFVSIDIANKLIGIRGKQSEWISPSPSDLGVPDQVDGCKYVPSIRERRLQWT